MRIGSPNSKHSPVGGNGQGGVAVIAAVGASSHLDTPPPGWAPRRRLNLNALHTTSEGDGCALGTRTQNTRPLGATAKAGLRSSPQWVPPLIKSRPREVGLAEAGSPAASCTWRVMLVDPGW